MEFFMSKTQFFLGLFNSQPHVIARVYPLMRKSRSKTPSHRHYGRENIAAVRALSRYLYRSLGNCLTPQCLWALQSP